MSSFKQPPMSHVYSHQYPDKQQYKQHKGQNKEKFFKIVIAVKFMPE